MSRYNYFTQTRVETNELKIFIDHLDIDLDMNLLAIIEDYVSKIKQSLTVKDKSLILNVIIKGDYIPLCVVYREWDENNPSGIYLDIGRDFMSEEENSSFDNDNLRSFFNEDDSVYLSDDAELICRVIQYLMVNVFEVSSNEVNLEIADYSENSTTDNSNSGEIFFKVFIWGVIILLVAATIFLFWAWIEFENTEYIIAAIVTVASGIWCVRKLLSDPHN